MCGRFTLHHSTEDIAARFLVQQTMLELAPRYNIAPSQEVPAVVQREARFLEPRRWGLVPSWAKDPAVGSRMINARAESVADKPAFRQALRQRRCLVPASGYFEWKREGDRKVPHLIRRADGGLLGLAALWEEWQDPEAGPLRTVALITTAPNPFTAAIHTRMPAILDPRDEAAWLDPGQRDREAVLPLLRPFAGELVAYPVSRRVNRPDLDEPSLLEPAEPSPAEGTPDPGPPPQQLDLF
ncbi:MAG: SOS response-associated peptidase [Gemmatimonadota bacterium]